MQPFKKYQKTTEDNLQTTASRLAQTSIQGESAQDRSQTSVIQVPSSSLSSETKALLEKISDLSRQKSSLRLHAEITSLIKNDYTGDGTDFNNFYKVIAEGLSTSQKRNVSLSHLVSDAFRYRNMQTGIEKFSEELKNNAYYSLAMDTSISIKERVMFACRITNITKQLQALSDVSKALELAKDSSLYGMFMRQLSQISQKAEDIFERFQLERLAQSLIEKTFNTNNWQAYIQELITLTNYIIPNFNKLEIYYRIAENQTTPIVFFLETMDRIKKILEATHEEAEALKIANRINSFSFERFLNTNTDNCFAAVPNNTLILSYVCHPDTKDEFLINQASRNDLPLLYRLHLSIFASYQETLEAMYTKIVEDPHLDFNAIGTIITEINDRPEINTTAWDKAFTAVAKNKNLSVKARLNAADFIIEGADFEDLLDDLQADPHLNQAKAYYIFLLKKGHEQFMYQFLSKEPDVDSLGAFDALYKQKRVCIEAANNFFNACLKVVNNQIQETPQDQDIQLGFLEREKQQMTAHLNRIAKLESDIQDTYPLYRIVLEKSEQPYTIQDAIDELKLDADEYLNANAYILPTVLDPVKEDGFDAFDFDYLQSIIDHLPQMAKNNDAQTMLYTNSQKKWSKILHHPDYCVIKDCLNAPSSSSNPYVLKLKAIVSKLEKNFQANKHEEMFAILNALILNSKTCYGGQLQAIDNTYLKIMSNSVSQKNAKELAQEIVLKSLYEIRSNWVMEDKVDYTEDGKYVDYTPVDEDGSFIPDGPFMSELERFLDTEQLMSLYSCDLDGLKNYTFFTNRDQAADEFGRTHIGLDIRNIAGKVVGLIPDQSNPTYDLNIEAENWFLKNSASDKANIIKAFVKSYTLENVWQALADLIWYKTAESSKIELEIYADEACTQAVSPEDGIFMSKEDPLGQGACRFLESLGLNPKDCCYQKTFYYKMEGDTESYEVIINTQLNKQGIAAIFAELDMLPKK